MLEHKILVLLCLHFKLFLCSLKLSLWRFLAYIYISLFLGWRFWLGLLWNVWLLIFEKLVMIMWLVPIGLLERIFLEAFDWVTFLHDLLLFLFDCGLCLRGLLLTEYFWPKTFFFFRLWWGLKRISPLDHWATLFINRTRLLFFLFAPVEPRLWRLRWTIAHHFNSGFLNHFLPRRRRLYLRVRAQILFGLLL